jgi:excisionase family DNA binding protein
MDRVADTAERAVIIAPVPRVALTREQAAAALGMSLDSFERYVQPHIRMIRVGRLRLVPVAELERWANGHAERTLP